MLSVGDGIAIGGFIIVVAQFVMKKQKQEPAIHSDEACAAQYNELDKRQAVLETEFRHISGRLSEIDRKVVSSQKEQKETDKILFDKIDKLFEKIEELKH